MRCYREKFPCFKCVLYGIWLLHLGGKIKSAAIFLRLVNANVIANRFPFIKAVVYAFSKISVTQICTFTFKSPSAELNVVSNRTLPNVFDMRHLKGSHYLLML